MSDETVPVGEQVLTSGGDGIFPKGLTVGTVTKVSPGSELFLNIHVRPAADLSRLEEVLVVTKVDEKQTEPDQGTRVRAVDILAERLPGVPQKPDSAAAGQAPKNPANPNSPAAPKTTKPILPSAPGSDAQSTPKPQSDPPSANKRGRRAEQCKSSTSQCRHGKGEHDLSAGRISEPAGCGHQEKYRSCFAIE